MQSILYCLWDYALHAVEVTGVFRSCRPLQDFLAAKQLTVSLIASKMGWGTSSNAAACIARSQVLSLLHADLEKVQRMLWLAAAAGCAEEPGEALRHAVQGISNALKACLTTMPVKELKLYILVEELWR